MDRFIENIIFLFVSSVRDLKSNMDRFIGNFPPKPMSELSTFKIQYG